MNCVGVEELVAAWHGEAAHVYNSSYSGVGLTCTAVVGVLRS